MSSKKHLLNRVRGWLPKEPNIAYAHRSLKPRWKRPVWVALGLAVVVACAFFAYRGVQAAIFYVDPQADVTASYYEKTLNCSSAKVGDVVEVTVSVYWHGHVFPEFRRQVQIVDSYPQSSFQLVDRNNTVQYSGYGGGKQFSYLLEVTGGDNTTVVFPKPRLYLDNKEIPLTGASSPIELKNYSEEM